MECADGMDLVLAPVLAINSASNLVAVRMRHVLALLERFVEIECGGRKIITTKCS